MTHTQQLREALDLVDRLCREALPKFNWGASALDANAVCLLNEAPAKIRAALAEALKEPAPIDMVLHCPACGMQHIDGYEYNNDRRDPFPSFGEDSAISWANPPHRSHLCLGCGHIWRPADVPTNGVAAITTKGKNDSPLVHPAERSPEAVVPVVLTARPLEWGAYDDEQWIDTHHGFSVLYEPESRPDLPYSASLGEGDCEDFATLAEAQAWCQRELDAWVSRYVVAAPAPLVALTEDEVNTLLANIDSEYMDDGHDKWGYVVRAEFFRRTAVIAAARAAERALAAKNGLTIAEGEPT